MGNGYYRFSGAQWAGEDTFRSVAISNAACDFSSAMGIGAVGSGKSVTLYAIIGPQGDGYYPALAPGGVYYLNVKNTTACTTACDVYFDFTN